MVDIDVSSFLWGAGFVEEELEEKRRKRRRLKTPVLRLNELKVDGRLIEATVVNVGGIAEEVDDVSFNVIERRKHHYTEGILRKRVVEREWLDRFEIAAEIKPDSFTLMPGEGVKIIVLTSHEPEEGKIYELRLTRKVAVDEETGEVKLEGVCYWFKLKKGKLLRLTLSVDQADKLVAAEVDPFELSERPQK